jgi:hypothetical protein
MNVEMGHANRCATPFRPPSKCESGEPLNPVEANDAKRNRHRSFAQAISNCHLTVRCFTRLKIRLEHQGVNPDHQLW